MIFLRSTIFNIWFYGSTFVCTLAACLGSLISAPLASAVARGWAKANVTALRIVCGIKIEVVGWELIPGGPVIIASQHQSALDTFIWFALLKNGVYVLKQELIQIPILGWLLLRLGNIAVDRAAGASALRGLLKEGSATLQSGRIVVIFPEGTRNGLRKLGAVDALVAFRSMDDNSRIFACSVHAFGDTIRSFSPDVLAQHNDFWLVPMLGNISGYCFLHLGSVILAHRSKGSKDSIPSVDWFKSIGGMPNLLRMRLCVARIR